MSEHSHVVNENVLNLDGPFRHNLRSLFVNVVNPFSEGIPFDVAIQVMRYDPFNSSKPVPKRPRRVNQLQNVMRARVCDSNLNSLVVALFLWNDAQMNVSGEPLRRFASAMVYRIDVNDSHHVVVHDFFIHVEIHFFNDCVG
jgi:hypothetical protein